MRCWIFSRLQLRLCPILRCGSTSNTSQCLVKPPLFPLTTLAIIRDSCSVFDAITKGIVCSRRAEPEVYVFRKPEMIANMATTTEKPPNIAICSGPGEDESLMVDVESTLKTCVDSEKYVFLRLDPNRLATDPWQDNVELVVVQGSKVSGSCAQILSKYWRNGGKILAINSDFIQNLNCGDLKLLWPSSLVDGPVQRLSHERYGEVKVLVSKSVPAGIRWSSSQLESMAFDSDNNVTVIGAIRDDDSDGIIVFSQVALGEKEDGSRSGATSASDPPSSSCWKRSVLRDILTDFFQLRCVSQLTEVPKLTPCHVYTRDSIVWSAVMGRLKPYLKNGRLHGHKVCFRLRDSLEGPDLVEMVNDGSIQEVPMVYHSSVSEGSSSSTWDSEVYFQHLKTKVFGQVVWYCEVLTTTMDFFCSSDIPPEVVGIAGRQTKGRGRRDHVWLSPEGCAMFSLQIAIPLKSTLGRRLPFVQHLASLALVEGILGLPGYQDLNLKLKWPNDVYFGDRTKLGGVIVQSSVMADTVYCTAGCGLNVNNEKPTVCLEDVVRAANPELALLSRELVIANALNRFEELVSMFQRNGPKDVLPLYYSHWLHGGAKVKLAMTNGERRPATVLGLDDSGFLKVELEGSGATCSVQPDGNSFDMLHNMVIVRTQD